MSTASFGDVPSNGAASTATTSSGGQSSDNQVPPPAATLAVNQPKTDDSESKPHTDPRKANNVQATAGAAKEQETTTSTSATLSDPPPRTIILCFDGTGNKFGTNSNVIRFFHALNKQDTSKQIVYYQAGIGTYQKRQFMTKTFSWLVSKFDEAVARGFPDHVKDGYRFLMQQYRKGDKVCLFGFSRGAYTARALAGMIYKVGLLPAHNDEQLDFAFTMYDGTDKEGSKLAHKFKKIFAIPIKIDFLGVWDTVSSVGIIPRSLPHSSQNDGVRVFRHALALDEHRARFRPNIWGEPIAVREELDDEPEMKPRGNTSRDEWVYEPPAVTDVKEVWFSGCHADVGGGSHEDDRDISLSNIPLRWMIEECFRAKTGIIFAKDHLEEFGLDIDRLNKLADSATEASPQGSISASATHTTLAQGITKDVLDAVARIYDQLQDVRSWWVLEYIPMLTTYQQENGSWLRLRLRNYGRGRNPPYADNEVKVHISVKNRMENSDGYQPLANNWKNVEKSGMIKWVE